MHANVKWDESNLVRSAVVDQVMVERRAKRGFLKTPVSLDTVKDILNAARFAPSSSNTQPWKCYVLTGDTRDRITSKAVDIFRAGPEKLTPEYPFFPQPLHDPFSGRFNVFRGQLGDAVGVPRSDKYGRMKDVERQFRFFEAPVGLIFTMDRKLEWASFICYGCFLQNIMLAAKARGLDTCAQQIWSLQHQMLREEFKFPQSDMVVAGLSLGWADNNLAENNMANHKLSLEEFVTFSD
ncbi:nitroreductase [Rhizobium sp. Root483D2]|uniref:nitroreductase n=1 Tax=Rhizobium sp. Root483D2 TaxID=1736545 RepID=UPI0007128010|nr:nitroreductase [Rhizobium sp. Root483D2]KQY26366.1 nitroreductase [Rhizobium sp. Root483D2]